MWQPKFKVGEKVAYRTPLMDFDSFGIITMFEPTCQGGFFIYSFGAMNSSPEAYVRKATKEEIKNYFA